MSRCAHSGSSGSSGSAEAVGDPCAGGEHVSLRVRRHRPESVTERGHRDRVDPVGATHREVALRVLPVAHGEQSLPELAFVEAPASPGGDRFERAGEARPADDLAGPPPTGQPPELRGGGVVGQRGDTGGEHGRRGEAFTRVAGGWREQAAEWHPSEALVEGDPTVDTSRNGHGSDVEPERHLLMTFGAKAVRVRSRSRPPARVQCCDWCRVVGDECEEVTAHAAEVGRGDREHSIGRDRGVDRATTVADRSQPGLCRQVIDRRHHGLRGVASCERGVGVTHRRAR